MYLLPLNNLCHLSCHTSELEEAEIQFHFSGLYFADTGSKEVTLVVYMWHLFPTPHAVAIKFVHHLRGNSLQAFFTSYTFLRFSHQKSLCDVAQKLYFGIVCCLMTKNYRMFIWCKQSKINYISRLNVTTRSTGELPGLPGWSLRCRGSQVSPMYFFCLQLHCLNF